MNSERSGRIEKRLDTSRMLIAGAGGALLTLAILFSVLYFVFPLGLVPMRDYSPVPSSFPSPQPSAAPQSETPPTAPIVTNYRICLGEYERNCQPHDVYLYCYEDVGKWAERRCNSFKAITLGSQSGNKCGYTSVQVVCIGPK